MLYRSEQQFVIHNISSRKKSWNVELSSAEYVSFYKYCISHTFY